MAVSLLETFQTYLTSDVLEQISVFLGESPEATEMAVQAAVPALLAGLTERMSTTLGSERVMSLIKQVGARLDIPALLGIRGGSSAGGGSAAGGSAAASPPFEDLATLGSGLLAAIFGSSLAPIVETLATAAGLRTESALSLLSLLTSIVLGVLGREVSSQHLGAASLAALLVSQRDEINAFVPASLGTLMSGSSIAVTAEPPRPSRPATAWIVPAAVVLLLALAGWYFLRPHSLEERRAAAAFSPATPAETPTAPPAATPAPASPAPAPAPPAPAVTKAPEPASPPSPSTDEEEELPRGKMMTVTLPGGRSVKLEAGSANYQLDKFLAGGGAAAAAVPKSFTFDRLNFQSNSTSLMRRSRHIVSELIEILNAYPDVAIRLEGHTDDRGDAERNKTLSLMRANAIKAKLVAAGVAESRITTEGVGREKPIASNNTVEGRRQNRRIELVVVKR
jgi:OOP family OmpA-OmpF porin